METPTLKFPRSGRLVTPLSMGYWHLKKKMHCIISDSSTSNEDEKEETPLKRFPNRREEVAASVEETPRARPRQFVPVSSRRPVVDTQKENEDPLMTDSKSRRSLSQAGDVLTSATEPVDSEESDKKDVLPPIRRRRKAQKFWGWSSSPGSERKKNTASSSSAEDETENLSARSPRQAGDIFTTATKPADSDESDGKDNLPLIRRRRKAQKFWDESSSPKIEGQKNTASSGSAEDETENLSKALLSVRIGSTSPPLSGVDTRTQVRTEIQSDDNDQLSSDDKDKAKSPPLHQFNVQDRPKPPVTEPKNRTRKGIIRKLITPQTAPAKGTRKARVNFKVNLDDDESDFDELLEKLRNRKHENEVYDESQIDLNNTVCEWEKRNEDDRWFLESLDEDNVSLESCHKDALRYRTSKFDFIKDELATKLYNLYHGSVFQNRFDFKIPINWNVRMLITAGFCYMLKNPDGSKYAKIELSPKVVDRTSRLRDTLLHEMCHAASWLVHGYNDGHGNIFKFWGQRSFQLLGLKVTTYHTYVIETKYIYKCQGCGLEIGRHSKSLDTSRIICKKCKGRFELYVNDKRSNKQTPASERKQSAFSKFVEEEYKDIKAKSPHFKHGEVMSALSERWKTMKIRF